MFGGRTGPASHSKTMDSQWKAENGILIKKQVTFIFAAKFQQQGNKAKCFTRFDLKELS